MAENNASVRFIRLGMRAGYLEARKELHRRGLDFPSHPLVDDCLMKGGRGKYPELGDRVRLKELIAYPKRKEVFGRWDIIDSKSCWLIPQSEVPPEAFGEKFVGLYVVPGEIEKVGELVVVHPELVVVCHGVKPNFLGGYLGVVDESTRIPDALASKRGVEKGRLRSMLTDNRGGIFGIGRSKYRMGADRDVPSREIVFADIPLDRKIEVVGISRE